MIAQKRTLLKKVFQFVSSHELRPSGYSSFKNFIFAWWNVGRGFYKEIHGAVSSKITLLEFKFYHYKNCTLHKARYLHNYGR